MECLFCAQLACVFNGQGILSFRVTHIPSSVACVTFHSTMRKTLKASSTISAIWVSFYETSMVLTGLTDTGHGCKTASYS